MIFSSPHPAADPYFAVTLLALQKTSYALEAVDSLLSPRPETNRQRDIMVRQ